MPTAMPLAHTRVLSNSRGPARDQPFHCFPRADRRARDRMQQLFSRRPLACSQFLAGVQPVWTLLLTKSPPTHTAFTNHHNKTVSEHKRVWCMCTAADLNTSCFFHKQHSLTFQFDGGFFRCFYSFIHQLEMMSGGSGLCCGFGRRLSHNESVGGKVEIIEEKEKAHRRAQGTCTRSAFSLLSTR